MPLDTAKFTKGPGLLYLNAGVPAANTALALTAGVPAAGTVASYTTEGNTISVSYEQEELSADEASAPIETVISSETLSIAGEALQVDDVAMLKAMLATGTATVVGSYDLIKFGGISALTGDGVLEGLLLVWVKKTASNKYVRFQLYEAVNQAETSTTIQRTAYATLPYNFHGRPITSRAAGDQIGQWASDT